MLLKALLDVINQSAHLECQHDIFDHSIDAFFALLHDRYFIDGFFQKPNMHNDFQPDYAKCEHLIVMSLAIITCPFPWGCGVLLLEPIPALSQGEGRVLPGRVASSSQGPH